MIILFGPGRKTLQAAFTELKAFAVRRGATLINRMQQPASSEPRDGDWCVVTGGTHRGKSGTVRDINTSKTGHVTITVVQDDGDRFKTLAKNVRVESGKGGKATRAASAPATKPGKRGDTSSHDVPGFEKIAAVLRAEGGVDPLDPPSVRREFGAGALKVGGKIFAMPAQGTLVLKLPAARVDALVAGKRGKRFDPGHGRVMKEWIALDGGEKDWLSLTREARSFVGGKR